MAEDNVQLLAKLVWMLSEQSANVDVISVIRRDDVDSLINLVTTQQISPEEYRNSCDQGLLHLAGISTHSFSYPLAQYDAINCTKYLVQQSICPLQEDAVLVLISILYR